MSTMTHGFEATPFPVTVREALPEESAKLLDAVENLGWFIPRPELATALVAVCDDEIVGFAFMQLVPHVEPLYVLPHWRGLGVPEMLASAMQERMATFPSHACMAVAQNDFAANLCRQMGMREIQGTIFVKD